MTRSIITSVNAGVATLTLSQPEIRNAFSDVVIAEITAAFAEVGQRDDVRAVVLAAEGPAFCAGANLNWMRAMADYTREENLADAGKLAAMLHTIATCPHPTIARVQGDVYAGGMGLVAACDMAVAVQEAHFCLSEVKIGLIPATIAPYVLRAMGTRAGQRYFLTGERFRRGRGAAHRLCRTKWWRPTIWTAPSMACSSTCSRPARPPCAPASGWSMTWPGARSTPRWSPAPSNALPTSAPAPRAKRACKPF